MDDLKMWPKLLDLSKDECRGLLRRLELDSYSTVIGAFRAQGKLNETKIRILKDLREAFHISDDRHRAEIRRVVNDEYLSTVAKMIYGPNSEIEWNKEGSRRYLIIDRKIPQTALSIVANNASYVGKILNESLLSPANTTRAQQSSHNSQNTNGAAKLVTEDPNDFRINQNITKSNNNTTTTTTTNSKTEVNRVATDLLDEMKTKNIRINNIDDIYAKDEVQSGYIETKSNSIKLDHENSISKPTMMNRRRKTITAFDFETSLGSSKNQSINASLDESKAKLSSISDDHHSFQSHFNERTPNNPIDSDSKVSTTKLNACDGFNVAKVSTRVFEFIEGNTVKTALSVVKPSSHISKRTKIPPTRTIVHNHIAKTEPIKSGPTKILKQKLPIKSSNLEYTKKYDLLNQIRKQKVQIVNSEASTTEADINFKKRIESPIYRKDFIPIPSARNPNIVKTNDRTIMHVTPIQQNDQLNLLNKNQNQIPKKHIVQVISPQAHPRTITIHPHNVMFDVGRKVQDKFNDQVGNWQNYDPSYIGIGNEYANDTIASTKNNHSYADVIMEDIVYANNIEEDIIAEEYIASEEFSPDNVIEMVYDGAEV